MKYQMPTVKEYRGTVEIFDETTGIYVKSAPKGCLKVGVIKVISSPLNKVFPVGTGSAILVMSERKRKHRNEELPKSKAAKQNGEDSTPVFDDTLIVDPINMKMAESGTNRTFKLQFSAPQGKKAQVLPLTAKQFEIIRGIVLAWKLDPEWPVTKQNQFIDLRTRGLKFLRGHMAT